MKNYQSWGRYPQIEAKEVKTVHWETEDFDFSAVQGKVLPYGNGRSYGDSCLTAEGTLIDMRRLNRYLGFDEKTGLLRCEAGVLLSDILEVFVPKGWFLPVTPGTKFVTVGGAIANDIHGKNHHKGGTFGCQVTQFELLRSDGQRYLCSPTENSELFAATIGGLGLTGLILWAEFRLMPVVGPYIAMDRIKFKNIAEFFDITQSDIDERYEYTVAWIDCLAKGEQLGRGLYMLGNHYTWKPDPTRKWQKRELASVPLDAPSFALNTLSIKAFNMVYYNQQFSKRVHLIESYEPFFYPLDIVGGWNKLYGSRGFLQWQCVVPCDDGYAPMAEILNRISRAGEGSFLAVLKKFGDVESPGMLSFPAPGLTLALDFAFNGEKTLKLLNELDEVVNQSGGRLYPAKDARMSPESFQQYYPNWREFSQYIDPKFSSSFWERVTANAQPTTELKTSPNGIAKEFSLASNR